MNRVLFLLVFLAMAPVHAAVPEPDVVLHGRVTRHPAGTPHVPTGVTWTINGNAESLVINQTTLVSVNGETFYISRIPFETRKLADNTPLPATPNTLGLTSTAVSYSRSAMVDGRTAILPSGAGTFSYGAETMGLIERIDLVIGETFAEWSQRIFGAVVGQRGDADGDGKSNHDEYVAGTDPQSASSAFRVSSVTPVSGGGLTIAWPSVAGKSYSLETTTTLGPGGWTTLMPATAGTGGAMSFTHLNATTVPKRFYRIVVSE